jgi:hypothetical protein
VTHTTPGAINMNATFVTRLIVYAAVPVLTLFATQFPAVGSALVHWLAPMQKVMP